MTQQQKHPKGLYVLFFTEMWERFSYYGLKAILALFMANALLYDKGSASKIFGTFGMFVYLMPLIGGYIADRYWGNRKAIYIGGILISLAQFILFASAHYTSITWQSINIEFNHNIIQFFDFFYIDVKTPSKTLLYLGLFIASLGVGFLKPNISNLVGGLYQQNDLRRDSAYTLFYMGINIGAFIAPLMCVYFSDEKTHDYENGFLIAGLGMLLGLLIFYFGRQYLVTPEGFELGFKNETNEKLLTHKINKSEKLTISEIQKIAVVFILSIFMIAFWGCFEQAGTALTYYAAEQVHKPTFYLFGFLIEIKAGYFQSVNPLCILLFAPFFSFMWLKLANKNKEIHSIIKMALGMLLLGCGFYILVLASQYNSNNNGFVSPWWLIGAYALHTFGELCLSPIGLSLVSKLSPVRFTSLMFAIWFGAVGFGNYLAGIIGSLYPEKGKASNFLGWDISSLSDYFLLSALLPIITAVLLFLIYPFLKKMMHDVK